MPNKKRPYAWPSSQLRDSDTMHDLHVLSKHYRVPTSYANCYWFPGLILKKTFVAQFSTTSRISSNEAADT
jgi:hypothetical protein